MIVLSTWLWAPGTAHASEIYLDIDISEQVMSQVVDGQVGYSTHVSTGNGEKYWSQGRWAVAETPRGWFEIYSKRPGWVEGPLGSLYNAMYFHGGYAIHGSRSVPDYPASHGCVRVPMSEADALYDAIGIGTRVHVHD
jgi:lipoprotein-anchoring transpeptidase ErfK/SrfK